MSSINRPELPQDNSKSFSSEKPRKRGRQVEKIDIAKQGISSFEEQQITRKTPYPKTLHWVPEGLDIEQTVKKVGERSPSRERRESKARMRGGRREEVTEVRVQSKSREASEEIKPKSPLELEREGAIKKLYAHTMTLYFTQQGLYEVLSKGLSAFDAGFHSFQYKNLLYVVSREAPHLPLTLGIVEIAKRKYLGQGGYGKVYAVTLLDVNRTIALKLSKKKLKNKGPDGKKIPMTEAERRKALITGTRRGKLARMEIKKEMRIMQAIRSKAKDFTGLNIEYFGKAVFNNQVGYFIKMFTLNGVEFYRNKPPAEACFEVMQQLEKGLNTMHSLNWVHRDIKLQNILIKENGGSLTLEEGKFFPSCDAAITDFGNTTVVEDLFKDPHPYPSLDDVIGHATICFFSKTFRDEIENALKSIRNTEIDSDEYIKHIDFIKSILIENDRFALGIALYTLWTNNKPGFQSYRDNNYFTLDKGMDKTEKMEQIRQEIQSASFKVSLDKFQEEGAIAKKIVNWIELGLGEKLREV